jgi:hypothetical protein
VSGNHDIFDVPPGQLADGDHHAHDEIDEIDAAVARISSAGIEDRLRSTLRRAGYGPGGPSGPAQEDIGIVHINVTISDGQPIMGTYSGDSISISFPQSGGAAWLASGAYPASGVGDYAW